MTSHARMICADDPSCCEVSTNTRGLKTSSFWMCYFWKEEFCVYSLLSNFNPSLNPFAVTVFLLQSITLKFKLDDDRN